VLNGAEEVCIKFLKPQHSTRDQETQMKNFQREVTLMWSVVLFFVFGFVFLRSQFSTFSFFGLLWKGI
jgi:hypothetical protein